jgi:hypothetical protein
VALDADWKCKHHRLLASVENDRAQLFTTCSHYVSSKRLVATFVRPSRAAVGFAAFPAIGDVHHDTSKAFYFLDAGTRTYPRC